MEKEQSTPLKPKKKTVDYARIEPGWRAGILSPRQLATQYTEETGQKVSHAAIIKHFGNEGVPRDLKARIQAKAESLVTAAQAKLVTQEVTQETRNRDRSIVDANAQAMATVLLAQREDIQRGKSVVMRLLEELEHQTGVESAALLAELGDLLRAEDDKGQDKLNDLYRRIISLPDRARTMKSLADSLRVMIDLQRQALGMDAKGSAPDGGSGASRISVEFVRPQKRYDEDE